MPSGEPFIVTAPLGRGRTVLVATDGSLSSVDPTTGEPWTAWPTWPSYLPLIREVLAFATGGQHKQWQQLVGSPLRGTISGPLPLGSNEAELQISRPDGRTVAVSLQSSPAGWEWSYLDTDVSGVYSLRRLAQGQIQQFAVNPDTVESDLTQVDPTQLPQVLTVRGTWHDGANVRTATAMTQSAWSQSILWVVVALLFAELFMAWQFGRGAV